MKTRLKVLLLTVAFSAIAGSFAIADNSFVNIQASTSAWPAPTTVLKGPFTNFSWKGITEYLVVISTAGDATLACNIQGQDLLSGTWFDIPNASFASQAHAATPTPLQIYPSVPATTNVSVNGILPRVWREKCVVGPSTAGSVAATSIVFTMGGALQQ